MNCITTAIVKLAANNTDIDNFFKNVNKKDTPNDNSDTNNNLLNAAVKHKKATMPNIIEYLIKFGLYIKEKAMHNGIATILPYVIPMKPKGIRPMNFIIMTKAQPIMLLTLTINIIL